VSGLEQRISALRVLVDYEVAFDKTSFDAMGRACDAFHDFKVNCGHFQ
jgi:hypothetical protein